MEGLRTVIHGCPAEARKVQLMLDQRGMAYRTEYDFEADAWPVIINTCFGRYLGLNNIRIFLGFGLEEKSLH